MSDKNNKLRQFCVSLVYKKGKFRGGTDIALRMIYLEANSKDEALGGAINEFSEEFGNWFLAMYSTLEINLKHTQS